MRTVNELLAPFETRAKAAIALVYDPERTPTLEERVNREAALATRYLEDVGELAAWVRKAEERVAVVEDLLRAVSWNPKGEERASGRTTRLILRGVIAVSEGQDVMVIARTIEHGRTIAREIARRAKEMGIPLENEHGFDCVIRFATPHTSRVGFRGVTLIDHTVVGGDDELRWSDG